VQLKLKAIPRVDVSEFYEHPLPLKSYTRANHSMQPTRKMSRAADAGR